MWQPLVTGRVFLPTDLSYKHDYVWRSHTNIPGLSISQNETLSDITDYYFPFADYTMQRLFAGQFPLWNPYISTGAPLFAAMQAAVLDPINLLTYIAGPLDYWLWGALLRLAIIGYTMYGFARALGRSEAGAITAGVALMVSGFVAVWLNYGVVTVLTWVPGMLWSTTRMMQTGRVIWMAVTGAAMGALILGGHPETQFLSGLFWLLFGLYWFFQARRSRINFPREEELARANQEPAGTDYPIRTTHYAPSQPTVLRRLALLAGAGGLGLALSAVQWLPFAEFLLGTSAIRDRATPVVPFDLGQMALRLAVAFFPNFGGTPTQGNYWVPPFTNFNEQTSYIGLLTVGLAAFGAVAWLRRDRMVPFFAGAALVSFLLAIRVPGSEWIRSLPVFSIGHGVRWALVWSLSGAVLAGYGVDALLTPHMPKEPNVRTTRYALRNVGFSFIGAAVSGALLLLGIYLGIRDGAWERAWGSLRSHEEVTYLFHPLHLTLYIPLVFLALGGVVLLAGWRRWLPRGGVVATLVLLLYAELWTFGSRYNPVTPASAVFPPVPATNFLSANLGHERLAGLNNTMRPNAAMVFTFRDTRGYEDLTEAAYQWLYGRFKIILQVSSEPDLNLTANQHRLLSVASTRYLLTLRKPRVDGSARPYRSVLQDDKLAIYENLEALPRAYLVFSATIVPDELQAAKDALLAQGHDPRRSVVLSGAGTSLSGPDLDLEVSPVTWLRDEPEDVELSVDAQAQGYLVLSDNYASGWQATVDGKPAEIIRANVAFRAVQVPPGKHVVKFEYRPALFYIGAGISAVAVVILMGLPLAYLIQKRRV